MREEVKSLSGQVFVRTASGLVRTISLADVFMFNVFFIGLGYAVAVQYIWAAWMFPGGSIFWGHIVATILCTFMGASYAYLSIAMPRSGGDYVFASRILHPAIGFASSWNLFIWSAFWTQLNGTFFVQFSLSSFFSTLGFGLNNPSLIDVATAITKPVPTFVIGSIVMWLIALLITLPQKIYFTFQKIMFIIAMVGLLVTVGLLVSTTRSGFIATFNEALKPYSKDTYESIIAAAKDAGWNTNPQPSAVNTVGIVPIAFLTLGYGWYTAYFSGEVKEVAKSQMAGIVGSLIFSGVFMAVVGWLYETIIGYEFLSALAYIFYVGGTSVQLPFAPYYTTIVGLLTKNPILVFLVAITLACWGWQWICGNVWAASRGIFAWSYDRLGPEYLSRVHSRWHTPYASILAVYAVAQVIMVVYVFTPYLGTLGGMFGTTLTFFFVALSALLLPYRRKDIFEKMPLRHRIAGIPAVSICGALGVFLCFVMFYYAFTVPALGMITVPMEFALVVVFALGFIIYYSVKAYRMKKGIDIALAYREVPPA